MNTPVSAQDFFGGNAKVVLPNQPSSSNNQAAPNSSKTAPVSVSDFMGSGAYGDSAASTDPHTEAAKIIQNTPNPAGKVALATGEVARQAYEGLTQPWSPIGWVTDAIGGATKLLGSGVEAVDNYVAPKIGSALRSYVDKFYNLTPEESAQATQFIKGKISDVNNSQLMKGIVQTYGPESDVAHALGSVQNVALLAGTIEGAKDVSESLPKLKTSGSLSEKVGSFVSGVPSSIKEKVTGAGPTAKTTEGIAGQVTNAKPNQIPTVTRGLSSIDTTGVSTFSDLKTKLNEQIKTNSSGVDSELGKNTSQYNEASINKSAPVKGGEPIVSNPVGDMLGQLKDFYDKTNSPTDSARIQGAINDFKTKGLTLKQMNDLAREHGAELDAFTKGGDLASASNKQSYENTRSSVKETIRQLNPNDTTHATDLITHDLITTRDLVSKMESEVQKLNNKIKDYGAFQKVGRVAGKAFDLFTGGLLKGFAKSVLDIGKDQGKTMNALDLQKSLNANLRVLRRLNMMDTPTVVSKLGEILSLPAPKPGATNASVETPMSTVPPTITDKQAPGPGPITENAPTESGIPMQISQEQKQILQISSVNDAIRFRSKAGFLKYVENNPAIQQKISYAGLTADSVWNMALDRFKKMGATNPLARNKASFPIR